MADSNSAKGCRTAPALEVPLLLVLPKTAGAVAEGPAGRATSAQLRDEDAMAVCAGVPGGRTSPSSDSMVMSIARAEDDEEGPALGRVAILVLPWVPGACFSGGFCVGCVFGIGVGLSCGFP